MAQCFQLSCFVYTYTCMQAWMCDIAVNMWPFTHFIPLAPSYSLSLLSCSDILTETHTLIHPPTPHSILQLFSYSFIESLIQLCTVLFFTFPAIKVPPSGLWSQHPAKAWTRKPSQEWKHQTNMRWVNILRQNFVWGCHLKGAAW